MLRRRSIAASRSPHLRPPRRRPPPSLQATTSLAAPDGGRGASATANSKIRFVKTKKPPGKTGRLLFDRNGQSVFARSGYRFA
jgi:hypothetical protein